MKFIKTFPVRFFLVLILLIAVVSLSVGTAVGAQQYSTPTTTPMTSPTATAAPPATVPPSASAAASPSASPSPTQRVVFGQVMSLASDKTSFVVQNEDLNSITVNVGPTTRYFIVTIAVADISGLLGGMGDMMGMGDMSDDDNVPGMSNMPGMSNAPMMSPSGTPQVIARAIQMGTFSSLTVGDMVLVRGFNINNVAREVIIIRFSDTSKFIEGKVSAVTANSFTITPTQGSPVTLGWDANTKVLMMGAVAVQSGQSITAVYDSSKMLLKLALVKAQAATATPQGSPIPSASPAATPSKTASPAASPSKTASPAASPSGSPVVYTINTLNKTGIGTYLVDANFMTLYITMKDSVGVSNVTGATLQTWPVFFTQSISVPSSLNSSDFGTITRSDGTMQTTFRGYPLYHYSGDMASGDTNGQGIGGVWFAVTPSKFPPSPSASASP